MVLSNIQRAIGHILKKGQDKAGQDKIMLPRVEDVYSVTVPPPLHRDYNIHVLRKVGIETILEWLCAK